MKNGNFIGQFDKPLTSTEIDKVVSMVKNVILSHNNSQVASHCIKNGLPVSLTPLKIEKIEISDYPFCKTDDYTIGGKSIDFYINGLDYVNRNRKGDTVQNIKKITLELRNEYGWDDYDLLKTLEAEGLKDIEHATMTSYGFKFLVDGKKRRYRGKRFYTYEPCNSYIYNTSLDDGELLSDFASFFNNLLADKLHI